MEPSRSLTIISYYLTLRPKWLQSFPLIFLGYISELVSQLLSLVCTLFTRKHHTFAMKHLYRISSMPSSFSLITPGFLDHVSVFCVASRSCGNRHRSFPWSSRGLHLVSILYRLEGRDGGVACVEDLLSFCRYCPFVPLPATVDHSICLCGLRIDNSRYIAAGFVAANFVLINCLILSILTSAQCSIGYIVVYTRHPDCNFYRNLSNISTEVIFPFFSWHY